MKKFLVIIIVLFMVLVTGCTKVEGKYKEGTYYAYDTATRYSVVMYVDSSGKIRSVFFDSIYLQECGTRGVISTCKNVTSKQALGDDYGMKPVSLIEKEWYEQVNAFGDKVVQEQGLEWLEFKFKDTNGNITATKPDNTDENDKIYTDSVAGVTIVVDNLSRLINDALKQAEK